MEDFAYINQAAFIICGMFGGFAHYLKKFLKKETDVGLFDWYGKANLAASLYTVIIFIFTMIGALAGDIVNSQTGFWASMYTGFVTGFAIDAGFNSDGKISDAVKEGRAEARALNESRAEARTLRKDEAERVAQDNAAKRKQEAELPKEKDGL